MEIKFKKLKKIEQIVEDKSYDFEVENVHRIIARKSNSKNAFYTSNCNHPDIEEFITSKQTPGKLTKFNMSVLVSDEFMEAVKNNKPWNLKFPKIHDDELTDEEKETIKNIYPGKNIKELYKKHWDGNYKKWKELSLPFNIYKTYENANELWNILMQSTYNRNEPGILFYDTINQLNNLRYMEHISATNPCIVGETKVAVANGKSNITIKELADAGEDVPVYCLNDNGKITISMMRNPRITGYNQPIYKITIENGHTIRVTGNHKFRLKNGEYKEAKDLIYGDSLYILNKFDAKFEEVFENSNSSSQKYTWYKDGDRTTLKSEHRLISEFYNNCKIPKGYVVHHIDFDARNNEPNNLLIMSKEEHDILHKQNMLGDKNPMVRAKFEWSTEKWNQYKENMSKSVSGEKNGRYSGIKEEDFRNLALELTEKLGRRFSTNEWYDFCESNNKKYSHTNWRIKKLGTVKALGIWAALKLGYDKYLNEDPRVIKSLEKWTSQGYNCKISNGQLIFIKECEICNKEFETTQREHSICSNECNNIHTSKRNKLPEFIEKVQNSRNKTIKKYKDELYDKQLKAYSDLKFNLNREPLRKEWEETCKELKIPFRLGKHSPFQNFTNIRECAVSYNHKIISVELDGVENVYNGTVDNYHNFFVGEFEENVDEKNNLLYINNLQCGEQLLPVGGSCLLGSINVTQFINDNCDDWDYEKLKEYIPYIVRLMDNVNDFTYVPLEEQKTELMKKRRIGLGIMGFGSSLMMMKVKYGSEKSKELTEKLIRTITNQAYKSSALLAKEKGSFEYFDKDQYLESNFLKVLDEETINYIKKYGMRNSHTISIQPTGNCVRKNTIIKTNKGDLSMNDIFKMNSINITKSEKNKWYIPIQNIMAKTINGYNRITALYINDKKDILSIKTNNNNLIEGTNEHKVLVKINDKEAIWKKLEDLKIGDKILTIQPK